jgi:hypothetical protein
MLQTNVGNNNTTAATAETEQQINKDRTVVHESPLPSLPLRKRNRISIMRNKDPNPAGILEIPFTA